MPASIVLVQTPVTQTTPQAPASPARRTSGSLAATPPDPAKVMKAAQDFEAMAIGQLLEPMFDTVDTADGEFGGGAGEQAWKPMLVQEFAKQMEQRGGIGLAKPVYEAMMRMQTQKGGK